MAQLSYQIMGVNAIIARALYIIRAESVYQAENQDARQFILETLNDILALWNVEGELIPYFEVFEFVMQTGVGVYILGTTPDATVPLNLPMTAIDFVKLLYTGFQYPVDIVDNFGWEFNTRATNVTGRRAIVWVRPEQDNFTL